MRTIVNIIVFSLVLAVLTSCGMQNPSLKKPQAEQQLTQDESQIRIDTVLAERAKKTAETVKGVRESTAVVINNEITIAVKASGFDRFRLKPIKAEVHDRVKEHNKDYNVYVTSDKKLFMQLQQIEQQIMGGQDKPHTDIKKKVNKINDDMRT